MPEDANTPAPKEPEANAGDSASGAKPQPAFVGTLHLSTITSTIRWVRSFVLLPLALAGIAYASFVAGIYFREVTRASRLSCLAQGPSLRVYLADYDEAATAAQRFVNEKRGKLDERSSAAYGKLLGSIQPNTGQAVFFSEDPVMKEYRTAHFFFENLGVLVRSGTVDFAMVFEFIAFPDTFWAESEELRRKLSTHWNAQNPKLDDFADGIAYLHWRYRTERTRLRSAARQPWQSEEEKK